MESNYHCFFCGKFENGFGNNPFPFVDVSDKVSRCCDNCNTQIVIPMRFAVRECSSPDEQRQKVKDIINEHNKSKIRKCIERLRNKRRRLN